MHGTIWPFLALFGTFWHFLAPVFRARRGFRAETEKEGPDAICANEREFGWRLDGGKTLPVSLPPAGAIFVSG